MPGVLAAATALGLVGAALAASLHAVVVSVGDGDSLRLRSHQDTLTVRLACIDAPELSQRPHGPEARAWLRRRLPARSTVRLRRVATDRYGRTVAEVFQGGKVERIHGLQADGEQADAEQANVGLAMVAQGQAFVEPRFVKQCDARAYRAAEARARRRRLGIWAEPAGLTRPWDHRRSRR